MRFFRNTALLAALGLTVACGSESSADLSSDEAKASYTIGRNMAGQLRPAAGHLDLDAMRQGIADAFADVDSPLDQEEQQRVMDWFNQTVQEEHDRERAEAAARNESEGVTYLAENGERDGVTTTESGLQYEVMRPGEGPMPVTGQSVTIHYRGTLPDGTEFDSSYESGQPATFSVDGVIPGFAEGLKLMPVGSQYRFVIPGVLGYGERGSGAVIGPNQTLVFEVELISVQ